MHTMKTIPLTQGKVAIVDDEDYEKVNKHKWYAAHGRNDIFYAQRLVRKNGKHITIKMHRLIMDCPKSINIDHKNRKGLDNRKTNLRFATPSQNQQNSAPNLTSLSQFKGVVWHSGNRKWRANIRHCDKFVHLGYFKSETEAGQAYNKAALELFGTFARLNKIKKVSLC